MIEIDGIAIFILHLPVPNAAITKMLSAKSNDVFTPAGDVQKKRRPKTSLAVHGYRASNFSISGGGGGEREGFSIRA